MSADALKTEISSVDGGVIVSLRGTASMELCDELNGVLLEACQRKPRLLILDLADLKFICSLGLGGLVAAYLRVRRDGGQMALVAPNDDIREMLRVTKLGTILLVYDTSEQALADA